MSLLQTDLEPTKNPYYAATAPRGQRYPALQSNVDADVAHRRRWPGRACRRPSSWPIAATASCCWRRARSAGAPRGRNGGSDRGSGLRPVGGRIRTRPRRRPADLEHDLWEALRLIGERRARFGIECDWRGGYLGLAVNERKARELRARHDQMQRDYGYETRWIAAGDAQWIASPRFHSGIPTRKAATCTRSVQQWSGRRAEPGRAHPRGFAVTAGRVRIAGQRRRLAVSWRQSICRASRRVLESRAMPVGTSSPSGALDGWRRSLIPRLAAVCDTNFVLDSLPPHGRPALRRPRAPATPMNRRRACSGAWRDLQPYAWGGLSTPKVYAWGRHLERAPFRRPQHAARSPSGPTSTTCRGFSGHGWH